MVDSIIWTETLGGPHLLVAEELLGYWEGSKGWWDHRDPDDNSDYARACRVDGWLGRIPCGSGDALVLSGDVGPIAWFSGSHRQSGVLAQWIAADGESDVITAVLSGEALRALSHPDTEEIEFETGASGAMRLIDSVDSGSELMLPSQVVCLDPGAYVVRAAYFETSDLALVIRQMARIEA